MYLILHWYLVLFLLEKKESEKPGEEEHRGTGDVPKSCSQVMVLDPVNWLNVDHSFDSEVCSRQHKAKHCY